MDEFHLVVEKGKDLLDIPHIAGCFFAPPGDASRNKRIDEIAVDQIQAQRRRIDSVPAITSTVVPNCENSGLPRNGKYLRLRIKD